MTDHHPPHEPGLRADVTAAARAVGVSKLYGEGDTAVRALDDVSVAMRSGAVHRDHGPVGVGQVDAAARARRSRPADVRRRSTSATRRSPGSATGS